MRIQKMKIEADLSVVWLLNAIDEYKEEFNERANTLLYSSAIQYGPAMIYGNDPACLTIRMSLRDSIPVTGGSPDWWALIGPKGLLFSGGM